MRFTTTIQATGATTTGVPVPEDALTALGGGRRPKVRVTIRGHTYRSSVATVRGSPMISLSAEHRGLAGVAAGDEVEVDLELDDAPRTVEVPADLAAALADDEAARRTWSSLSYSNQRWHVLSIEGAKSSETRARRVAKSIGLLREGRAR